MSRRDLRQALGDWPLYIVDRVLGYADTVEAAAPEIFREVGIARFTRSDRDRLVFAAGIRKLWSMLEFQRRTIQAVLSGEPFGFSGVAGRGVVITHDSAQMEQVRQLQNDLRAAIEAAEMWPHVTSRSLADVVRLLGVGT